MEVEMRMTAAWDIAPCNLVEVDQRLSAIALMMEAIRFSETSVYFYETTGYYITEDCYLHILRRELTFFVLLFIRLF
jgi:hypothetical protein